VLGATDEAVASDGHAGELVAALAGLLGDKAHGIRAAQCLGAMARKEARHLALSPGAPGAPLPAALAWVEAEVAAAKPDRKGRTHRATALSIAVAAVSACEGATAAPEGDPDAPHPPPPPPPVRLCDALLGAVEAAAGFAPALSAESVTALARAMASLAGAGRAGEAAPEGRVGQALSTVLLRVGSHAVVAGAQAVGALTPLLGCAATERGNRVLRDGAQRCLQEMRALASSDDPSEMPPVMAIPLSASAPPRSHAPPRAGAPQAPLAASERQSRLALLHADLVVVMEVLKSVLEPCRVSEGGTPVSLSGSGSSSPSSDGGASPALSSPRGTGDGGGGRGPSSSPTSPRPRSPGEAPSPREAPSPASYMPAGERSRALEWGSQALGQAVELVVSGLREHRAALKPAAGPRGPSLVVSLCRPIVRMCRTVAGAAGRAADPEIAAAMLQGGLESACHVVESLAVRPVLPIRPTATVLQLFSDMLASLPGGGGGLSPAPLERILAPGSEFWDLASTSHGELQRAAGAALVQASSVGGAAMREAVLSAVLSASERRVRTMSGQQPQTMAGPGPREAGGVSESDDTESTGPARRWSSQGERGPSDPGAARGVWGGAAPLLRFSLSVLQRIWGGAAVEPGGVAGGDGAPDAAESATRSRRRTVALLGDLCANATIAVTEEELHVGALKLMRRLWTGTPRECEALLAAVLALRPSQHIQLDVFDWLLAMLKSAPAEVPRAAEEPLLDVLLKQVLASCESTSAHVSGAAVSALGKAVTLRPLTPLQMPEVAVLLARLLSHPSNKMRSKASEILHAISPFAAAGAHPALSDPLGGFHWTQRQDDRASDDGSREGVPSTSGRPPSSKQPPDRASGRVRLAAAHVQAFFAALGGPEFAVLAGKGEGEGGGGRRARAESSGRGAGAMRPGTHSQDSRGSADGTEAAPGRSALGVGAGLGGHHHHGHGYQSPYPLAWVHDVIVSGEGDDKANKRLKEMRKLLAPGGDATRELCEVTARTMVTSRLRAPLGSMQSTFAGLDALAKSLLSELRASGAAGSAQYGPFGAGALGSMGVGAMGGMAIWGEERPAQQGLCPVQRGRVFLDLVFWIERGVAEAQQARFEGGDEVPEAVLAFFWAHEGACQGQIARMRGTLLQIASAVGYHHAAVHFGMAWMAALVAKVQVALSGGAESSDAPTAPGTFDSRSTSAFEERSRHGDQRPALARLLGELLRAAQVVAAALAWLGDADGALGVHTWVSPVVQQAVKAAYPDEAVAPLAGLAGGLVGMGGPSLPEGISRHRWSRVAGASLNEGLALSQGGGYLGGRESSQGVVAGLGSLIGQHGRHSLSQLNLLAAGLSQGGVGADVGAWGGSSLYGWDHPYMAAPAPSIAQVAADSVRFVLAYAEVSKGDLAAAMAHLHVVLADEKALRLLGAGGCQDLAHLGCWAASQAEDPIALQYWVRACRNRANEAEEGSEIRQGLGLTPRDTAVYYAEAHVMRGDTERAHKYVKGLVSSRDGQAAAPADLTRECTGAYLKACVRLSQWQTALSELPPERDPPLGAASPGGASTRDGGAAGSSVRPRGSSMDAARAPLSRATTPAALTVADAALSPSTPGPMRPQAGSDNVFRGSTAAAQMPGPPAGPEATGEWVLRLRSELKKSLEDLDSSCKGVADSIALWGPASRVQVIRDVALLGALTLVRAKVATLLEAAPRAPAVATPPALKAAAALSAATPPIPAPLLHLLSAASKAPRNTASAPLVVPALRGRARVCLRACEVAGQGRPFLFLWKALGLFGRIAGTGRLVLPAEAALLAAEPLDGGGQLVSSNAAEGPAVGLEEQVAALSVAEPPPSPGAPPPRPAAATPRLSDSGGLRWEPSTGMRGSQAAPVSVPPAMWLRMADYLLSRIQVRDDILDRPVVLPGPGPAAGVEDGSGGGWGACLADRGPLVLPLEESLPEATQEQLAVAAAYALCQDILLADGSAYGSPHQHIFTLLKLLKVASSFGTPVVKSIGEQVLKIPGATWRPLVSQLMAIIFKRQGPLDPDSRASPAATHLAEMVLLYLANHAPQVVLYPVVVETRAHAAKYSHARPKLSAAMAMLRQQAGGHTVANMDTMLQELDRITLLWEELWASTLSRACRDFQKRMHKFLLEVQELGVDSSQVQEQAPVPAEVLNTWRAVMGPTLQHLEHASQVTSQAPQTPQERWFATTYQPRLAQVVSDVRQPTGAVLRDLGGLYTRLDDLRAQLQAEMASSQVELSAVSPKLAEGLDYSAVPVPAESSVKYPDAGEGPLPAWPGPAVSQWWRTDVLSHIQGAVQILHSKTRPKRITMVRADGVALDFLLKGREDLRLDQRVMTMLRAFNASMLQHEAVSSRHDVRALRVRVYDVVPLGNLFGLIGWVRGAEGLYGIFEAHEACRQRALLAQRKAGQHDGASHDDSSGRGSASRDSGEGPRTPWSQRDGRDSDGKKGVSVNLMQQFYVKLVELLVVEGCVPADNPSLPHRSRWSRSALKKAVSALQSTGPKHVLSRRLMISSGGLCEYWGRQGTFTQSMAAASMLGWVLGLGDRHPDNILVDLATGEVVHIDYNVIFDAGLWLEVPEKVPFRLTVSLQHALGPMGAQGRFKLLSERVVEMLRSRQGDALLLAESFLLDPLVDWAAERHEGAARMEMDFLVTLQLLSNKLHKDMPPFVASCSAARSALDKLIRAVGAVMEHSVGHEDEHSPSVVHLHAHAVEAAEAAAIAQSRLVSATEEQEQVADVANRMGHACRELQESLTSVISRLRKSVHEFGVEMQTHKDLVHELRRSDPWPLEAEPQEYLAERAHPYAVDLRIATDAALQTVQRAGAWGWAGVALRTAQDCDGQGWALLVERDQILATAVDAAREYIAALSRICPPDYESTSAIEQWNQGLEPLIAVSAREEFTVESVHAAWRTVESQTPSLSQVLLTLKDLERGLEHAQRELKRASGAAAEGSQIADIMENWPSEEEAVEPDSPLSETLQAVLELNQGTATVSSLRHAIWLSLNHAAETIAGSKARGGAAVLGTVSEVCQKIATLRVALVDSRKSDEILPEWSVRGVLAAHSMAHASVRAVCGLGACMPRVVDALTRPNWQATIEAARQVREAVDAVTGSIGLGWWTAQGITKSSDFQATASFGAGVSDGLSAGSVTDVVRSIEACRQMLPRGAVSAFADELLSLLKVVAAWVEVAGSGGKIAGAEVAADVSQQCVSAVSALWKSVFDPREPLKTQPQALEDFASRLWAFVATAARHSVVEASEVTWAQPYAGGGGADPGQYSSQVAQWDLTGGSSPPPLDTESSFETSAGFRHFRDPNAYGAHSTIAWGGDIANNSREHPVEVSSYLWGGPGADAGGWGMATGWPGGTSAELASDVDGLAVDPNKMALPPAVSTLGATGFYTGSGSYVSGQGSGGSGTTVPHPGPRGASPLHPVAARVPPPLEVPGMVNSPSPATALPSWAKLPQLLADQSPRGMGTPQAGARRAAVRGTRPPSLARGGPAAAGQPMGAPSLVPAGSGGAGSQPAQQLAAGHVLAEALEVSGSEAGWAVGKLAAVRRTLLQQEVRVREARVVQHCWLYDHLLVQGGVYPAALPALGAGLGGLLGGRAGWGLQRRRTQVLGSLRRAVEHAGGLNKRIDDWLAGTSDPAERNVSQILLNVGHAAPGQRHPAEPIIQALHRRREWLASSSLITTRLTSLCDRILRFEASREGVLLPRAPRPGAPEPGPSVLVQAGSGHSSLTAGSQCHLSSLGGGGHAHPAMLPPAPARSLSAFERAPQGGGRTHPGALLMAPPGELVVHPSRGSGTLARGSGAAAPAPEQLVIFEHYIALLRQAEAAASALHMASMQLVEAQREAEEISLIVPRLAQRCEVARFLHTHARQAFLDRAKPAAAHLAAAAQLVHEGAEAVRGVDPRVLRSVQAALSEAATASRASKTTQSVSASLDKAAALASRAIDHLDLTRSVATNLATALAYTLDQAALLGHTQLLGPAGHAGPPGFPGIAAFATPGVGAAPEASGEEWSETMLMGPWELVWSALSDLGASWATIQGTPAVVAAVDESARGAVENLVSLVHDRQRQHGIARDGEDPAEAGRESGRESHQEGRLRALMRSAPQVDPEEERRIFIRDVYQRLRNKLRGRVGHTGRDLAVPDIVARLNRDATSLDNLAAMFEGWMPWL